MASSSRSEEHTSELQSPCNLVCRLLLEKKICRPVQVNTARKLDGDVEHLLALFKGAGVVGSFCARSQHLNCLTDVLLTVGKCRFSNAIDRHVLFFFYYHGAHLIPPFSPARRSSH